MVLEVIVINSALKIMNEDNRIQFLSNARQDSVPETVSSAKISSSRLSLVNRRSSLESGCNSKSSLYFRKIMLSNQIHPNPTNIMLSSQGVVTSRPNSNLEKRQIRDKSYYKGLLYKKGFEISSIIKKLIKQIDFMKSDQSTYASYKKVAESKALELQHLQATLAEYNLVIDVINTDDNITSIEEKCQQFQMDNEKSLQVAEVLFQKRKEKERIAAKLEDEINQDKFISEILLASGDNHKRYELLLQLDKKLTVTLKNFDTELIQLASKRRELENECDFLGRNNAKELCNVLKEREEKRDFFVNFNFKNKDFQKLYKMKEDIGELLQYILKETSYIKSQLTQKEAELIKGQQRCEGKKREQINKLEQLQKREEEIDEFFSIFNQNREDLFDECYKNERKITNLLKRISEIINLDHTRVLSTNKTVTQLLIDLTELDKLEDLTKYELYNLRQEMASLKTQLILVPETKEMKFCSKSTESELMKEKKIVLAQLQASQKIIGELKKQYDTLSNKLNGNKKFKEFIYLEKKWQDLEKENHVMLEFISNNKKSCSYLTVKNSVMGLVRDLNKAIIK